MAILDSNLPVITKGSKEVVSLKNKFYNLRTHTKYIKEDGERMYSLQVELEFQKCEKKILGVCVKKEKYKKWVEIPFDFYTPNFYPCYDPINVISKEDLDKEIEINLPTITTEEEWDKFCANVKGKHIKIVEVKS